MSDEYWSAPRMWPGETVAVIGGGPSLTQQHVDHCKGKCRVIAINDAIRLAPWADIHYFCDEKWWQWHHEKDWYKAYTGLRVTLENAKLVGLEPSLKSLSNWNNYSGSLNPPALSENPSGVMTGQNSGYQCINLGVHLGARRIVLLGIDMRNAAGGKAHWFGEHPVPNPNSIYHQMILEFRKLPVELAKRDIEVINCSPGSALDCFRMEAIHEVFKESSGSHAPAQGRQELEEHS